MNLYQVLISEAKIAECIKALIELGGESADKAILLSARWKANEKGNLLGQFHPSEYGAERNKIVGALSSIAAEQGGLSANSPTETVISTAYTRENILVLIQHYSRRNPEFSQRFKDCLEQFDSYQQAKIQYAGHDATGRQKTRMQADFEIIYNTAMNAKADNFEEEIAEIQKLLTSARVPTIEDLTKAYAIASGLGYRNSELERLLELPVHTTETRIRITEALEAYLKSL